MRCELRHRREQIDRRAVDSRHAWGNHAHLAGQQGAVRHVAHHDAAGDRIGRYAGGFVGRQIRDVHLQHRAPRPQAARVIDRLPLGEQRAARHQPVAAHDGHLAPGQRLAVEYRDRCGHRLAELQHRRARGHRAVQVGAQRARQPHGAFHVQLPRALLNHTARRQWRGGVLQDGLDQRRCEAGIGLQQQRRGAGHGGRGHRGAAQLHQPLVGAGRAVDDAGFRRIRTGQIVLHAEGIGAQSANNTVARGYEVRLDKVVDPAVAGGEDIAAAGGAARAEGHHQIVAAGRRELHVGRAHRDDRGLVPRR